MTTMKLLQIIVVILGISVALSNCTLSKSDKDKKKQQQQQKKLKDKTFSGVVDPSVHYYDILKDHFRVDYRESKKFSGVSLGYVTPWNNHGYDIAKFLAHKFTHISPVWFQVNRNQANGECEMAGTHDLDQGWLKDVRRNNSAVQLVPRILFDKWSPLELEKLFGVEDDQNRCADVIIDFLKRNRFDGAVVEIWVQAQAKLRARASIQLTQFIINLAEHFTQHHLQFILTVPPILGPANEPTQFFPLERFLDMEPYVDYFSVMLYDFPNEKGGPVAPIEWVRNNLVSLLEHQVEARKKLLMGLNFYGYDYDTAAGSMDAVVRAKYLQLLDAHKPEIMWNKNAAEHYFTYKQHLVYYPTLSSLDARLALAHELGVGIAVWETGQGLDYFYNLL